MKDSPVDALKKTVVEGGWKRIQDFVSTSEKENFFTEFKRTEEPDYLSKSALAPSEKKNLAKAISGFGNSEGGVVVWGIDASKDKDGNDYAKAIIPIKGVRNFASLLESFTHYTTVPMHTKVEHIVICDPLTPDEGVVATIIPRSERRPLQNIFENDFKYYLRSGDSFAPIPHGVLQGMFGVPPQPELIYMYNVGHPKQEGSKVTLSVGVMMINTGLGIAEDVFGYIRIFVHSPSKGWIQIADNKNYDFQTAYGVEMSFMSKPEYRLGVEQRTQPLSFNIDLEPPFTHEVEIEMLVGCKNSGTQKNTITKSPQEIQEIYEMAVKNPNSAIYDKLLGGTTRNSEESIAIKESDPL